MTPIIAIASVVLALGAAIAALRARDLPILRRIVIESLPILVLAGAVDVLAGLTIEKRFESFLIFPALLVLVPAFLEDSGSLGAILAARISTKLHLGTLGEGRPRFGAVIEDVMLDLRLRDPRVRLPRDRRRPSWRTSSNKASPGLDMMLA